MFSKFSLIAITHPKFSQKKKNIKMAYLSDSIIQKKLEADSEKKFDDFFKECSIKHIKSFIRRAIRLRKRVVYPFSLSSE